RRPAEALAAALRRAQLEHVVIAARGSSDNAARYAKYVLGSLNGLSVGLAAPSLFTIYKRPPRFGRALALAISQSGQSPDIVAVLAEARRQGALTAVITNAPDSPLAEQGDFVLELGAGPEQAVAASKTYTASLAAIALLSASLADSDEMRAALERLPAAAAASLALDAAVAEVAPRYRAMARCVVIGRGYNYATAFELALKLKELTYAVAEPYSSADFLHGPLALIEPGFPAIVIAPSGAMTAELRAFSARLRQRQADLLAISDDAETLRLAATRLTLPQSVPEWLSPLTAILPGQLLALHLAAARGHDVDAPRGLRKVTETR
ncbi:MAG: SIS domain-containing protein, partial [Candidatus Promineifilaceae bacterium]